MRSEERCERIFFAFLTAFVLDPSRLRDRDRLLAAQIRAGDAAAFFGDFVRRAGGDDLAAEAAGAGAEVEQAVGAGDHFAIVLDDEQRVAEVAQSFAARR